MLTFLRNNFKIFFACILAWEPPSYATGAAPESKKKKKKKKFSLMEIIKSK